MSLYIDEKKLELKCCDNLFTMVVLIVGSICLLQVLPTTHELEVVKMESHSFCKGLGFVVFDVKLSTSLSYNWRDPQVVALENTCTVNAENFRLVYNLS